MSGLDISRPLFDFVRSVRDVETQDQLIHQFDSVVSALGYEYFVATHIAGQNGVLKPVELFGKTNKVWEELYFRKQLYRFDDCLSYLAHANKAFTWDDVKQSEKSTEKGRGVMNLSADFGLSKGAIVPVKGFDGSLSLVTLFGDVVDQSEDAMACLEVAGLYFSGVSQQIQKKNKLSVTKSPLTPKQTEVVNWLAVGKRYDDIADIMNVNTATIERHVEHARKRMNVVTRDQLVLAAFRQGIIDV